MYGNDVSSSASSFHSVGGEGGGGRGGGGGLASAAHLPPLRIGGKYLDTAAAAATATAAAPYTPYRQASSGQLRASFNTVEGSALIRRHSEHEVSECVCE